MYRGRLQRDLAIWVEKGLISSDTAVNLLKEVDARPQSFTVGRVLMMLAAVLVSAAILLFVAANWDGIDRSMRTGLLILLIWAFHGLAAFTATRGSSYLPGVFLVLGSASFGASIALIGQMYHLSGDELSAALTWFAATAVTAVLYRSAALTYVAGGLAWFTLTAMVDSSIGGLSDPWFYLPFAQALVVIGLVRYTGADRARHLAYALILGWLAWTYVDQHGVFKPWHFIALGVGLFLLATLPVSPLREAARKAGAAPAFYSFVLAIMGFVLYQVDNDSFFDSGTTLKSAIPAGMTAAMAVLAIALDGRDNGAVRYLGYAVFTLEILYLSMAVAGTIIGTSGLFLFSGVFLAAVAWLVIRLEKRFGPAREGI